MQEKRLTKYLIARYKRAGIGGRPLINSTDVLLVKFGLAMIQMDLDERQNQLTVSVWCRYVGGLNNQRALAKIMMKHNFDSTYLGVACT